MVKCIDKHNKFTKSLLGELIAKRLVHELHGHKSAVIPQFASLCFLLAHFLSVSAGVFQKLILLVMQNNCIKWTFPFSPKRLQPSTKCEETAAVTSYPKHDFCTTLKLI